MAISIDAFSATNTENTGLTFTAQHTTAAGSNRGMVVYVGSTSQSPAKEVRYNGIGMTQELSRQEGINGRFITAWSLIAPSVGTSNLILSFSAACAAYIHSITLFGVDQADMIIATDTTSGSTVSAALAIASTVTDLLVYGGTWGTASGSVAGGLSLIGFQGNPSGRSGFADMSGSAAANGKFNFSTTEAWAIGVVDVVAAGAAVASPAGSVVFDACTPANTENTGLFYTAQHTCSGTNRGLLAFIGSTSQATPYNVTYAGVAMTSEGSAQEGVTGKRMAVWSLIAPASGTNSLATSWSAAAAACIQMISFTGVNQSDMVGSFSASTGSSTAPTTHVSASATDKVVDGVGWSGATGTVGPNQTQRANQSNPSLAGGTSTEAGSAGAAMLWTLSSAQPWVAAAVNVMAQPASSTMQPATSSTISLDSITTTETDNTGTGLSFTHAVAGTNRGLLALVANTSQAQPGNVTYNGVQLTREGVTQEVPTGKWVSIWSLIAPATGTNNVLISYSAAVAASVTIVSLNNVDQIDMVGGYTGAWDASNTPNISLSATVGDLLFDCLGYASAGVSALGSGQTLRANHGNAYVENAVSSKPDIVAGAQTTSWNLTGTDNWVLAAVNVRPSVVKTGQVAQSKIAMPMWQDPPDMSLYNIISGPVGPDGAAPPPPPPPPGAGTTGPDPTHVGVIPYITDDQQWKRQVSNWINQANQGKLDNTGTVTLTANAASTTVTDSRVGVGSYIGLTPTTADAAAEDRSGNLYVTTTAGSFTIAHTNNAQTDRTFTYSILG